MQNPWNNFPQALNTTVLFFFNIISNFYFSYRLWGSGLCGKLVDWIDGREEIAGTGVMYTIGEFSWGGGREM